MSRTKLVAGLFGLATGALAAVEIAGAAGCGDTVLDPILAATSADAAVPETGDEVRGDVEFDQDAAVVDAMPPIDVFVPPDAPRTCSPTVALPSAASSTGAPVCAGDLARVFRFVACACEIFDVSGQLSTNAFDSNGDGGANALGASVGANGVGTGNAAVALSGTGSIGGDLRSGADLDIFGGFSIAGSVFANGDVSYDPNDSGQPLDIGGALYVPEGGSVDPGVTPQNGIVYGPVADQPCDCAAPIDIVGIVSQLSTNNDNASIGFPPAMLPSLPAALDLPCGRYYYGQDITAPLIVRVTGHVGLFVAGSLSDSLQVVIAPGAEFDLFVAGDVIVGNDAFLGDLTAPARVRVYVGHDLQIGSGTNIGANVYAPGAVVTIADDVTLWGAFVGRRFNIAGNVAMQYDMSVLGPAATGCASPGGTCATCDDCPSSTPACVNGKCVPCVTSSDCCAPLFCNDGRCVEPGG